MPGTGSTAWSEAAARTHRTASAQLLTHVGDILRTLRGRSSPAGRGCSRLRSSGPPRIRCEDVRVSNSDPGHPWQPDVLGEPWQARTIDLRPDAGGTPVATLVRHLVPSRRRGEATPAVLYLHGFNDYFFQADHAAAWVARGYDFYAVDLRDHGRSIRPGRRPGQVPGLAVHTEELHAALRIIHATRPGPVVLLGHSTGGLIGALYA